MRMSARALVKLRHVSKVILMNGSTRSAETAWDTRPSSENARRCACICGLSSAEHSRPFGSKQTAPLISRTVDRSRRYVSVHKDVDISENIPLGSISHAMTTDDSQERARRRQDSFGSSLSSSLSVELILSVIMKTEKSEESAQ